MSAVHPHTAPARSSSVASQFSNASEQRDGQSNGSVDHQDIYNPSCDDSSATITQHFPPSQYHGHPSYPPFHQNGPYPNAVPNSYLPPLSSSPPPHAPPYVPPPQHAMSPDPIHGMMPPMGAWPNGPPPGWRPGPGPAGYPSQGYRGAPNGVHPGHGSQDSGYPMHRPGPYQSIANGTHLSGPSHDSREKRQRERSHHREDEMERDSREDEVITTIFVVGFPDDMSEREFQNIFTFAPGFEAATLKFPSGSARSRETSALIAELTQLAAAQAAQAQAALAAGEQPDYSLQAPIDEALAALQISAQTSSSTTPSAAVSLTPSAPSGHFGSGLPQLPSRRQTIGFARFKARADALAARELLQGKKVDSLTGASLKAEMAKKNLHAKRNNPGEELVGMLLRTGRLAGLVNAGGIHTGPPLPPQSHSGGQPLPPPAPPREAWDPWHQHPPAGGVEREIAQEGHHTDGSASSTSPPSSVKSPNSRPADSKALLALAEEADELEGWSPGGAVPMGIGLEGLTPGNSRPNSGIVNNNQSSLSRGTGLGYSRERERSSTSTGSVSGSLPAISSSGPSNPPSISYLSSPQSPPSTVNPLNSMFRPPPSLTNGDVKSAMSDDGARGLALGGIGGSNPADQNPPINTLYVGNLPAISPPTHPPNFLEESLRALFSQCSGFKRMSFRQKINGPMCFVEFEDVQRASQAIKDLYGNNLSGLVKGGIRLSYSKNSLGQRGASHPAGVNSALFGGIAHTVALAGMSSPTGQNNFGLPAHQGQNSSQGSQSVPVPMPGDARRGSEVTLSPTAQPFNAPFPGATSPRSRYFASSPSGQPEQPSNGYTAYGSTAIPAQPIPTNQAAANQQNGQFSPVSSPIRTPASFSWVSSGSASIGVGNGGYGFDPFSPNSGGGNLSLSGAASAWQQSNGGTPM